MLATATSLADRKQYVIRLMLPCHAGGDVAGLSSWIQLLSTSHVELVPVKSSKHPVHSQSLSSFSSPNFTGARCISWTLIWTFGCPRRFIGKDWQPMWSNQMSTICTMASQIRFFDHKRVAAGSSMLILSSCGSDRSPNLRPLPESLKCERSWTHLRWSVEFALLSEKMRSMEALCCDVLSPTSASTIR